MPPLQDTSVARRSYDTGLVLRRLFHPKRSRRVMPSRRGKTQTTPAPRVEWGTTKWRASGKLHPVYDRVEGYAE